MSIPEMKKVNTVMVAFKRLALKTNSGLNARRYPHGVQQSPTLTRVNPAKSPSNPTLSRFTRPLFPLRIRKATLEKELAVKNPVNA